MDTKSSFIYIYYFVASTIVAGEGVLHDPTLLKEKGMLQTSRHSVNLPPFLPQDNSRNQTIKTNYSMKHKTNLTN